MDNNGAIAVFDSGLGGIGVLRELVAEMPCEDFLYFGDCLHAPYGVKSAEEVLSLTTKAWEWLQAQGCKAMVIACNTATSVAVASLRENYPDVPFIGMEPAVKPALAGERPKVLVLATEMTLKKEKFHKLVVLHRGNGDVFPLPAPKLVEFVERGELDSPALDDYLQELLTPFRYVTFDAVVLGCTHFPFVKQAILKNLGYQVEVYDGAPGTARETKRRIDPTANQKPGTVRIVTSGGGDSTKRAWELFQMES